MFNLDIHALLFSDTEKMFNSFLATASDDWPLDFKSYFEKRLEKDIRASAKYNVLSLGIFYEPSGVSF